jgi:hypothetical protein
MRVAVLVLALAGCKREGEANAPRPFSPAPRYAVSLEATLSGCTGPMSGYAGEMVLTAKRRRVELALTLTPKDVLGMSKLLGRPLEQEFRTCRWVGRGAMKQGRWVVSLARVDAAEVDVCGEREGVLELECGTSVVQVDGTDEEVMTCSVGAPFRPGMSWLLRDGVVLSQRGRHARVEGYMAGTQWTLVRPAPR